MIDFQDKKLGDISYTTDYVANGSFASLKENVQYNNEQDFAILVRLTDFKSNWNKENFVYVTESSYNFLSKSSLVPGDIIISNVGAYSGTVFKVIDLGRPMTLGPNSVLIRFLEDDSNYMYYYLKSRIGQYHLKKIISGSAQPKFNKTELRNLVIEIPEKSIQKKIGSILSPYDKLIENNTKRIEILEEMAQRIYKEWFEDFKYPGHENGKLIDSELGMIPQDWQILEYDSITNIISRGPSIKYVNEDSGIPVLNQKCVRNGEIELDAIKYGSPLNTKKEHCYLQLNDILINSMGVGTLGRISRNLSIKSKMIIHNCVTFVRADESKVKQSFLYYSLKRNQIYFEQLGVGATGQTSLKIDIIKRKEVIVPKQNLLNEFDKLVNPIWKEIGFLKNKNHNLLQTRDHLLPKLISGKVDVSDVNIDTSILDD